MINIHLKNNFWSLMIMSFKRLSFKIFVEKNNFSILKTVYYEFPKIFGLRPLFASFTCITAFFSFHGDNRSSLLKIFHLNLPEWFKFTYSTILQLQKFFVPLKISEKSKNKITFRYLLIYVGKYYWTVFIK